MGAKYKLLDLFCGAGGAGAGYVQAGFEVHGVDIVRQRRYPYPFTQEDAIAHLMKHWRDYDVIHASPPCQKHSVMRRGRWKDREHEDFISNVRELLKAYTEEQARNGKQVLWVIENVVGAPLVQPFMLCGTMFGLQTTAGNQLRRHRLFETNCKLHMTKGLECQHNTGSAIGVYGGGQHPDRRRPATIGVYGHSGGSSSRDGITMFGVQDRRDAMGIHWMTGAELSQAIPPAYTKHIGQKLIAQLDAHNDSGV